MPSSASLSLTKAMDEKAILRNSKNINKVDPFFAFCFALLNRSRAWDFILYVVFHFCFFFLFPSVFHISYFFLLFAHRYDASANFFNRSKRNLHQQLLFHTFVFVMWDRHGTKESEERSVLCLRAWHVYKCTELK